jgi:cellulose synthase/poly-beta-1,6-N-acetylglucosamine synthase-like glycosyltransferase
LSLKLLYDLLYLTFVQLILSTLLVLSPARGIGSRFRWTGSRITEVIVGGVGAVAISAAAVGVTHAVWGLPVVGLGTGGYLLVIVSVAVMALRPNTNVVGQVFYASYASAAVVFIVYAGFIAFVATRTIPEMVTSSLVIVLDLAAFVVWMSNMNYVSDVLCRARRGRPLPAANPGYQPFVSLHIPAYNEPPELLIETIRAVERIDYPNFEVVVIDNNTKDPAVWGPVEEYCRDRERVKFVHVAPWPGYKAGACNLALRRYTDPRAEIIGLVDADDIVQPHYLRETVPYFSDPSLGFVQTFEGNREFEGSDYYTACVDSFQAFYLGTMSSRNERDSVPFVGTMGLFRRSALTAAGGWNEWCICEDTEASLRVARDGWSGLYIPRCFGRGVVPPSFAGMLTQRHRWCFGAMQILRLHWRSLMPWDRSADNHLTSAQRRDYLMAALSWFRDLFMLAFSLLLLVVTGLTVTQAGFFVSPMDGGRSLMALSLVIIYALTMQWTLSHWTTMSLRRALLSLVISLSVTWVVALGCIEGVARRDGVFLRTSKAGGRRSVVRALRLTRVETTLAVALYAAAGVLAALPRSPWLLIFIVAFQGSVYACGPIASVWNLSAQGVTGHESRRRFQQQQEQLRARRSRRAALSRPAAAALTALCVGGVTSAFLPPAPLLHTTSASRSAASRLSLLTGAHTYLELGTGGAYYPVTKMHLSNMTAAASLAVASPARPQQVGLSFNTSSLVLLGRVLRAGVHGGRIGHVSLAVREPGPGGRPVTELVETFGRAVVSSFTENLSGRPSGSVSLVLPAPSRVASTPAALRLAGPFAALHGWPGALATRASVRISQAGGNGAASYAVSEVELSQAAAGAPVNLRFTTSSRALLHEIHRSAGGPAARIPVLRLSVSATAGGAAAGGSQPATAVTGTFSRLGVGSFAENLSGSLAGTATLVINPR